MLVTICIKLVVTPASGSAISQSFVTSHMPCLHSGRQKITFCITQHATKWLVKHSDLWNVKG